MAKTQATIVAEIKEIFIPDTISDYASDTVIAFFVDQQWQYYLGSSTAVSDGTYDCMIEWKSLCYIIARAYTAKSATFSAGASSSVTEKEGDLTYTESNATSSTADDLAAGVLKYYNFIMQHPELVCPSLAITTSPVLVGGVDVTEYNRVVKDSNNILAPAFLNRTSSLDRNVSNSTRLKLSKIINS